MYNNENINIYLYILCNVIIININEVKRHELPTEVWITFNIKLKSFLRRLTIDINFSDIINNQDLQCRKFLIQSIQEVALSADMFLFIFTAFLPVLSSTITYEQMPHSELYY